MTSTEQMLENDHNKARMGIELISDEPGSAVLTMAVKQDMLNGFAITHGGAVFALADTAFAVACNETDAVTVAAGADITFIKPTREGDVLTATATRVSLAGRSGVYDVVVTDQTGDTVALFRGRSRTTNLTMS